MRGLLARRPILARRGLPALRASRDLRGQLEMPRILARRVIREIWVRRVKRVIKEILAKSVRRAILVILGRLVCQDSPQIRALRVRRAARVLLGSLEIRVRQVPLDSAQQVLRVLLARRVRSDLRGR